MGSYWYLNDRECPYCGKSMRETVVAENEYDADGHDLDYSTWRCEHCRKQFRIDMEFVLSKIYEEEKKELETK